MRCIFLSVTLSEESPLYPYVPLFFLDPHQGVRYVHVSPLERRLQGLAVSHTYALLLHFVFSKRVYLLVRLSGTKTLQERVENDVFASKIFDTLRSQFSSPQEFHAKVIQKIVPVRGDITIDRLGLSEADQRMIHADTRVVINSAASVSFDDPLNNALEVNLYCYITNGRQAKIGSFTDGKKELGDQLISDINVRQTTPFFCHQNLQQLDEHKRPLPHI